MNEIKDELEAVRHNIRLVNIQLQNVLNKLLLLECKCAEFFGEEEWDNE